MVEIQIDYVEDSGLLISGEAGCPEGTMQMQLRSVRSKAYYSNWESRFWMPPDNH